MCRAISCWEGYVSTACPLHLLAFCHQLLADCMAPIVWTCRPPNVSPLRSPSTNKHDLGSRIILHTEVIPRSLVSIGQRKNLPRVPPKHSASVGYSCEPLQAFHHSNLRGRAAFGQQWLAVYNPSYKAHYVDCTVSCTKMYPSSSLSHGTAFTLLVVSGGTGGGLQSGNHTCRVLRRPWLAVARPPGEPNRVIQHERGS